MIELSLEVLTQKADVIAIGRCVSRSVNFNEDRTFIYTDYTFQVTSLIKGKAIKELVVRQPGGEIGEIGMRMAGTARFLPFEEVLIFASAESEGVRRMVGHAQGKFRIITEKESGTRYAVRDVSELILIREDRQRTQARVRTPIKLDDLVGAIEANIADQEKRQ